MPHAPAAAARRDISIARSTELLWLAPASAMTWHAPRRIGAAPSTATEIPVACDVVIGASQPLQQRPDAVGDARGAAAIDRAAQPLGELRPQPVIAQQAPHGLDDVAIVGQRADAEEHDPRLVAQVRVGGVARRL